MHCRRPIGQAQRPGNHNPPIRNEIMTTLTRWNQLKAVEQGLSPIEKHATRSVRKEKQT